MEKKKQKKRKKKKQNKMNLEIKRKQDKSICKK